IPCTSFKNILFYFTTTRDFHSSVMDQPSRKTRTTWKTANHQPSPPAEFLGYFGGFRALRADGSCMKRQSHGCILSTSRLSRKLGALPPLSVLFIAG
uniref:Uncharacterized protein n=1 Tax=Suricata suricatta TaxID=37032 RepID=A0A673VHE2_SURSU